MAMSQKPADPLEQLILHSPRVLRMNAVVMGIVLGVLAGAALFLMTAWLILKGGENLPEPNWKEKKTLGDDKLGKGFRLACQLWIHHDIELTQEFETAEAGAPEPAPAEIETTTTG